MLCMAQVGLWSWTIVRWVAGAWRPPGRVTSATWWRRWRRCCWRCQVEHASLRSWKTKKKFLVKRLLDLLCKQMLQFHSSYISYKQYVDTHISWLSSLSFWALPGMAAHRATVSEKKGAESVYASFVVSSQSWKTISFHFIYFIYLLKQVGGI